LPHKPFAHSVEALYTAITGMFERGGNVIIPTFALERAQALVYLLREGVEQKRLAPFTQVFLDSPPPVPTSR
jgi:metallo-beta-lactamase family protein